MSNQPISEQYRVAAKEWVEADKAARMLEETKTAVLSQRMKALGDKPAAHAERDVKASPEWHEFIKTMVDERGRANLLKVRLKYIEMKYYEHQSDSATKRSEMRM